MQSKLDQFLSQAIDGGAAPGVVALAADLDGVIYSGAFGRTAPGADTPMRLDSSR